MERSPKDDEQRHPVWLWAVYVLMAAGAAVTMGREVWHKAALAALLIVLGVGYWLGPVKRLRESRWGPAFSIGLLLAFLGAYFVVALWL